MQQHVVGFKIFDGRSLQTQDGLPCDAFVVVECCGRHYQTFTLENRVAHCPWNEPCVWPDVELHPKEFESAFIEFKVYARNWFTRNYLIGKATLQLDSINKRKRHLYARQWLCLRNGESSDITGMLNVTAFCLKPGESAPSATEQETQVDNGDEDDTETKKNDIANLEEAVLKTTVDVPAGKPHHVMIGIHRVEDLRRVNGWLPSPYVTVEYVGCLVKTITAKDVQQYTFNDAMRIPVVTPVYEDTILIKLWHHNWLSPDELLAQGLISFSELRNNSLPPRWFNLYGWDPDEVPDVSAISAMGREPEPNYFRGRILVSGRVERLKDLSDLKSAGTEPARTIVEPPMSHKALFADVYMVAGAAGRNCCVEVAFGCEHDRSSWVSYDTESMGEKINDSGGESDEDEDDEFRASSGQADSSQTFSFTQKEGRIPPLFMLTPEDPDSQPFVMISVFTDSAFSSGRRIGYAKKMLCDFPDYEPEIPKKPTFIALETMPEYANSSNRPSVLVCIETHTNDNVTRHNRKHIKPMIYIVRAYCFMARRINYDGMRSDVEPGEYGLRVSCAGMSYTTQQKKGPRPSWMTPVNLKVVLCSDSKREPPTIEPITLTLVQDGLLGKSDLGKAVCTYTHLRRKDSLGKWQPQPLHPQWVKVFGGRFGNQAVAEVLVCFEMIVWKNRDEAKLQPREMWPQPEEQFDKREHFACLKKATLHFSLHGLRDLQPFASITNIGSGAISNPFVSVNVQKLDQEPDVNGHMNFRYRKTLPGGDPKMKSDSLRQWSSTVNGNSNCQNFEFFQVGKLEVEVPDKMLLQPCLRIKVEEESSSLFSGGRTLVGESIQSLAHLLPCCWLDGVDPMGSYEKQIKLIKFRLAEAERAAKVREKFREMTEKERKEYLRLHREEEKDIADQSAKAFNITTLEPETPAFLDSSGLPLLIRSSEENKRPFPRTVRDMNMQIEESFPEQHGDREVGTESRRNTCHGKLENSKEGAFVHDFLYKNVPLLRNSDIINTNDEDIDWNFQPNRTFGFVKCTFKLTDGWREKPKMEADLGNDDCDESDVLLDSDSDSNSDSDSDVDRKTDETKLRSSYAADPTLDKHAFKARKLVKRYKGEHAVPSRVRVRIYLVKAVCIYSKSSGFADPYIDFQLGQKHRVSMRNMMKPNTNTPSFYRIEERDIQLPEEGRLQIDVMDAQDFSFSDANIGSTVVDLEDRWHSKAWSLRNADQMLPVENRALFTNEYPGKNRGCLEMWVEMIESVQACDKRPSPNLPPPDTAIDVRFVITTASGIKTIANDNEMTNAKFSMTLTCKEYSGEYSKVQYTDVHYGSKGEAIFNWRVVFPSIKMPTESATVKVDLWHHETLMGDTIIGTFDLDIKRYLEKVASNLDCLTIGPSELKLKSVEAAAGDDVEAEDVGSVMLTMWVMTNTEALGRPVGIGRDEPNVDPQLISPTEGRDWGSYFATFGFAWPDFGLWKKLIPLFVSMIMFLASTIALKQLGLL